MSHLMEVWGMCDGDVESLEAHSDDHVVRGVVRWTLAVGDQFTDER